MTVCVVHRDGWAVTDSREMIGHTVVPCIPEKAFRTGWYVISVAGPARLSQKIQRAVMSVSNGEVIDTITEILDDQDDLGVQVLLVDGLRKLIDFDCHGCLSVIDTDYDFRVIGSAQDLVTGYMSAIAKREKRKLTPEDAVEAIKFAAVLEMSIDDRCQVVKLNG